MFIQTEDTPNPQALKFLPGKTILDQGTMNFNNIEEARPSKLATRLFHIEGIEKVFFGPDFISVTKAENFDWYVLKPHILGVMMEHFVANLPVLDSPLDKSTSSDQQDEQDPIVKEIKELIETRVRPAVAQDGGDILFDSFKDGIVYLKMQGACSGCPSSSATLKSGIENMLRYYIPEVQEVQAVA